MAPLNETGTPQTGNPFYATGFDTPTFDDVFWLRDNGTEYRLVKSGSFPSVVYTLLTYTVEQKGFRYWEIFDNGVLVWQGWGEQPSGIFNWRKVRDTTIEPVFCRTIYPGIDPDYILDFGPFDPTSNDLTDIGLTNSDRTMSRLGNSSPSHPAETVAYLNTMPSGVNLTFMKIEPLVSPATTLTAGLGFRGTNNVPSVSTSFRFPGSGSKEVGCQMASSLYVNNVSQTVPTGLTYAANDIMTLAVDTATGKFWYGKYESETLLWLTLGGAPSPDPLTGTDEHGTMVDTSYKFIQGFPWGNSDFYASSSIYSFP